MKHSLKLSWTSWLPNSMAYFQSSFFWNFWHHAVDYLMVLEVLSFFSIHNTNLLFSPYCSWHSSLVSLRDSFSFPAYLSHTGFTQGFLLWVNPFSPEMNLFYPISLTFKPQAEFLSEIQNCIGNGIVLKPFWKRTLICKTFWLLRWMLSHSFEPPVGSCSHLLADTQHLRLWELFVCLSYSF